MLFCRKSSVMFSNSPFSHVSETFMGILKELAKHVFALDLKVRQVSKRFLKCTCCLTTLCQVDQKTPYSWLLYHDFAGLRQTSQDFSLLFNLCISGRTVMFGDERLWLSFRCSVVIFHGYNVFRLSVLQNCSFLDETWLIPVSLCPFFSVCHFCCSFHLSVVFIPG